MVAVLYLATNGGRIGNEDAGVMLDVTRSMLSGSLSIPEHANAVKGGGGLLYSPYGPLVSLVWIPAVASARLVHLVVPGFSLPMLEEFAASFCSMIPSMGILLYLSSYWRACGASASRLRWGVGLMGVATLWWPYSKLPMSDPWMALGILAAVVHWGWLPRSPRHALTAGAWLGVAWLARKQAQMLVPLIFLAWWIGDQRDGIWRRLPRLALALLGMLPLVGLQLLYNRLRFGSCFIERYPNLDLEPLDLGLVVQRLLLMLFDTGNGFICFNLFVIATALLAWRIWWAKERGMCLVVLFTSLASLLFLSRFYYWNGGVCFGPRYLLFLTALLGLAWAHLPEVVAGWQKLGLALAALVGSLVVFAGVAVDSNAVGYRLALMCPPNTSPARGYALEVRRVFLGEPRPFPPEVADTVYATHPAFQVPDFWWCHFLRQLSVRKVVSLPSFQWDQESGADL